MKKLLSISIAVIAAIGTAFAYDFSAVAPTGQTLYYNIRGNNAVVTYPDSVENSPWSGYTMPTGSLTIPSSVTYNGITYSVTAIGDRAFNNCHGLTSVTIPNSVTSIGNFAFDGLSRMTSLTIPNSVTSIGHNAFACCGGITGSLTIPNSVTTIGNCAFISCSGLTEVTIPNSVTTIGNWAFGGCSNLSSITIPSSVTTIGNAPFHGCSSLTSIVVASGNTHYDSRNNCNAIIKTDSNILI